MQVRPNVYECFMQLRSFTFICQDMVNGMCFSKPCKTPGQQMRYQQHILIEETGKSNERGAIRNRVASRSMAFLVLNAKSKIETKWIE